MKACTSCRRRKIRCIQEPKFESPKCQPCLRAKYECVYAQSSRHKRCASTGARIAALEEQVEALRSTAAQSNVEYTTSSRDSKSGGGMLVQTMTDVVARDILSMNTALTLVSRYKTEMVHQFPAVLLMEDDTGEKLRVNKPVLFLAIIAAASGGGGEEADLEAVLNEEVHRLYSQLITIEGQKSLEIVQALLISCTWYSPPDRFLDLKFYQYIHIAATMALELGINQMPKPVRSLGASHPHAGAGMDDGKRALSSDTIDCRRAILACYCKCAEVAMSLRRPNMLRFSKWMANCVDFLRNAPAPESASENLSLISWVQLRRGMEEFGCSLGFEDPSFGAGIEDHQIQLVLWKLKSQMEDFRNSMDLERFTSPSMVIEYHVNNIYPHEIALHEDHNSDDFRPPFLIKTSLENVDTSKLPAILADGVMNCLFSAHQILRAFLKTEPHILWAGPITNFVRMIYSVVILIKLHLSFQAGSRIGRLLLHEQIQATVCLKRLIAHLRSNVDRNANRRARAFLSILVALQSWCTEQENSDGVAVSQHIEPCQHLSDEPEEELIERLRTIKTATLLDPERLVSGPPICVQSRPSSRQEHERLLPLARPAIDETFPSGNRNDSATINHPSDTGFARLSDSTAVFQEAQLNWGTLFQYQDPAFDFSLVSMLYDEEPWRHHELFQ